MHTFRLFSLIALIATSTLVIQSPVFSVDTVHANTTLTVTGVAANNSSVRVFYGVVSGARDYRVFDVADPTTVKYAGLVHLSAPGGEHFVTGPDGVTPVFPYAVLATGSGPAVYDGPADSIEWNRVEDGRPHTLIVQAVDQLGPTPPSSLYDNTNMPLMPGSGGMGMAQLGANEGMTSDGLDSINGQGPYTNRPAVIAASTSFVVQANATHVPIPSQAGATQTYLDTFTDAEGSTLTQTSRNDQQQTMSYRLNGGTPQAATLSYQFADTMDSFPIIDSGHFMDVLFDGGTPGTNNPLHQGHSSMMFTPDHTLSLAQGGMIHLTMEVDGHVAGRRWLAMALAPASSPLTNPVWEIPQAINSTDQALVVQFFPGGCTLNIFTGPTSSTNLQATGTAGGAYGSALWGTLGQAPQDCQDVSLPANFNQNSNANGQGLDSRNRYDLFLSQTHAALFIDGHLLKQSDIPAGSFPWANQPLQASFIHYVYHTDNDITDNRSFACYPENAYWFNDPAVGTLASQDSCAGAYPAGFGFQRSDERHWDNIGSEVLPTPSTPSDFSSLSSLINLPQAVLPVTGIGAGGTPVPTNTSVPTITPQSPTPVTTSTPTPLTVTRTPVPPTVTPTQSPVATNTPTRTAIPTNTPIPPASPTPVLTTEIGLTTPGTTLDSGDSSRLNASRVVTGSTSGTVTSMSAFVGSVANAPHNQYGIAIYSDANGVPGSLVAQSGVGTLTAGTWNTLPITASLTPGTVYWLVYNSNGNNRNVNNLYCNPLNTPAGALSQASQQLGNWPRAFGNSVARNSMCSLKASLSG